MTTTIKISDIRSQVDHIDHVPVLAPSDCSGVIVERLPNGRVDVIDGFHRLAGVVRWANIYGDDNTEIACHTSDDASLLGDAANPENAEKQKAAIAKILAS